MRWIHSLFLALLLVPLLFAGCANKNAAEKDSGPRLNAPAAPIKNPDKPQQNMPPTPPPPPPKK